MYRVLIVDDEKNIREGIRCKCDWAKIQIDHVDTAANGEEALRIMEQTCPDIVLTDIKMPGINGLELLKTISEHYPYTLTVVLSGYDEFELARDAMQYNAQKYILKPCNIEEIHDTVLEMVAILEDRAQRRRLEAAYGMAEEKKRQMAIRSCILGESIVEQHPILAYDSFCTEKLRLLLYQVYGDVMIRQGILEQLRSTLESFFDLRRLTFLCDVVGEKVIVCTQYYAYGILKRELLEIQSIWRERHSCRLQVAVSEMTDARTIAQSSQNLYKCLAASFFQEETDIITTFDKPAQNQDVPSGGFAPRDILSAIQRGDEAGIESCLEELFQFLNNPNFDIAKIKAYAVEVYLSVRRRADVNGEKTSQNEVDEILKSSSLCGIKRVFQREMHKMAQERRQRNQYSGNKLIYKVEQVVEAEMSNKDLSLNYIASKRLFVNAAYLGKMFAEVKKEKFARYLTRKRMERARELLIFSPNLLIQEVSIQTGFGCNTQYFCRVFKNWTGYTPSQFREQFRL